MATPECSGKSLDMQLLEAAGKCDLQEVRRLLEAGAKAGFIHDPEGTWGSRDKKGPLHAAIMKAPRKGMAETATYEKDYGNWRAVVETLLDAGADINGERASYDWRGCGSVQTAFEMALPLAMEDVELLELVLKAGGNPNTRSVRDVHSMRTDGQSIKYVLHKAVDGGNLEVARALLDAGAEVDAIASEHFENERGYNQHTDETSLHRACGCDRSRLNIAMCALLLARGADVNAVRKCLEQESSGVESPTDDPRDGDFVSSVVCMPVEETVLHMAIKKADAELVTMLVCAGADSSIKRVYNGVETTCEELCGGDEMLLRALQAEWSPETHKLFPAPVRESVETALMIANRQKWPLPETLLFRICALSSGPAAAEAA